MALASTRSWCAALLCGVGLWAFGSDARAQTAESGLRFSGYGTLAYSADDDDELALIRDISQRPREEFATGPGWRIDSRLALQADYQMTPTIGWVAQAVWRDQVKQKPDTLIELAHLNAQLGSSTRLRVGRIGFDGLLMSDHRNLGYAYVWVRPPTEFYGWIPIFSFDGADLSHEWGNGAEWRLRAQAGRSRIWVPMGAADFRFHADSLFAVSLQREAGPLRLKLGYAGFTSGKEVTSLGDFHAGLETIGALGIPGISDEARLLRREARFGDVQIRYGTFGAAYDDGRWLVQGEIGRTWTGTTMVPSATNAYLAAGYRADAITPFVLYSVSRPAAAPLRGQADWSAIGQGAFQTMAFWIVNSSRSDQATAALGVRWDIGSRAALKLQWDRTRIEPQGYAQWFRKLDRFAQASTVDQATIGLEFVF